jgi:hypothetical protein
MSEVNDEIAAMGKCVEAMKPLTREEVERVLRYLHDRFVEHRKPQAGELSKVLDRVFNDLAPPGGG